MAEGWLAIIKGRGQKPEINQLALSRHAGVPYRTVKAHVKAGFVDKNIQVIVEEFRKVTKTFSQNPGFLAIRTASIFEKHSVWFAIEGERQSILLWATMRQELHESITTSWNLPPGRYTEALYALFWFRLYQIAEGWRYADYDIAMREAVENEIRLLVESCKTGRIDVAAFGK